MAGLTPEQAADVVDWAGDRSAAARAIGVPRSTFVYWLDPEPNLARFRRNYAADPEAKARRNRTWYEALSGLEYNRRLLYMRRVKALHRRAQREQKEAT